MKWDIQYSSRANDFIDEQGIRDKVRASIRDFILRISGRDINMDIKKLKGEWAGYYRIRKGKVRIILKPDIEARAVFVDAVDFRGSAYK